MATQTKTETKSEVEVKASAKVAALIVAVVSATVETVSRKRQLAEGIVAEASRAGYDKKQASQMVALSYVDAYKMDKATESDRAKFMLKIRPDVSKVITLAYPAKPAELASAYAHNDKLPANSPKANRIGENTLLEIARGNLTFKQALANKAAKRQASRLDAVLTPVQRFENSVAGILAMHKVGANGRLSIADAKEAFNRALDAYAGKAKTAAK